MARLEVGDEAPNFILPAIDTGQLTGMEFIENQTDQMVNTTSKNGDYMQKFVKNGNLN